MSITPLHPRSPEPDPSVPPGDDRFSTDAPPSTAQEPRIRFQRTGAILAWVVLLGVAGWVVGRNLWNQMHVGPGEVRSDRALMRFQARYLVGVPRLLPVSPTMLQGQAQQLDRGPYGQRLRYAALAGELVGVEEAQKKLRELQQLREAGLVQPVDQQEVRAAEQLAALYRGYAREEKDPDAILTPENQELLRTQLGWFGKLALLPKGGPDAEARDQLLDSAKWTTLGVICWVGFVILMACVGLFLAVLLGVLWVLGHLQGRMILGSQHGSVYAETFALYLALFFGFSLAPHLPVKEFALSVSGAVALSTLVVLAWPVLRGVPWQRVRQDIGLHTGKWGIFEPLLGVGVYAAGLPLVVLGGLVTFVLILLRDRLGWGPDPFGPSGNPSHPVVGIAAQGGWLLYVQLFFTAAVAAPIVEEIMFRGVFYQHLREGSRRLGGILSVLVSTLWCSFLFAVIHPQGILAVPILAALALAFNLAREWRGSLLPSMVAHGINNSLAILLLLVMTGL
jgi:membrane protease YdiL (CAAX protease family)